MAEGFATAATIQEIVGGSVAVAFNANNLKPVAISLREKFPKLRSSSVRMMTIKQKVILGSPRLLRQQKHQDQKLLFLYLIKTDGKRTQTLMTCITMVGLRRL